MLLLLLLALCGECLGWCVWVHMLPVWPKAVRMGKGATAAAAFLQGARLEKLGVGVCVYIACPQVILTPSPTNVQQIQVG